MEGGHARSLMERAAVAGRPAPMLTVQYRMASDICDTISENFYDGKLETAPGLRRAMFPGWPRRCWVNVTDGETAHVNAGYSNEGEAEAVVAEALKARRVDPRCVIFLITFYNKQKYLIERLLKQASPPACSYRIDIDRAQYE